MSTHEPPGDGPLSLQESAGGAATPQAPAQAVTSAQTLIPAEAPAQTPTQAPAEAAARAAEAQRAAVDALTTLDRREPDAHDPDVSAPEVRAPEVRAPDVVAPDVVAPDVVDRLPRVETPDGAATSAAAPRPARRVGLDVARGLMLLVSVAVNAWLTAPAWFEHATWVGVNPVDLVFPTFVTLSGCGLAYAYGRRVPVGPTARRVVVLLIAGFAYNAHGQFMATGEVEPARFHVLGVLQFYAAIVLLMALLHLVLRSWWLWPLWTLALAGTLTWALADYASGCPTGQLTPTCNPSGVLDPAIFGAAHIYHGGRFGHDPEGVVALAGALVAAGGGASMGHLLARSGLRGTRLLAAGSALVMTYAGAAWWAVHHVPAMKRLWTPPFSLGVAAACGAVLLLLHLLLDSRGPGLSRAQTDEGRATHRHERESLAADASPSTAGSAATHATRSGWWSVPSGRGWLGLAGADRSEAEGGGWSDPPRGHRPPPTATDPRTQPEEHRPSATATDTRTEPREHRPTPTATDMRTEPREHRPTPTATDQRTTTQHRTRGATARATLYPLIALGRNSLLVYFGSHALMTTLVYLPRDTVGVPGAASYAQRLAHSGPAAIDPALWLVVIAVAAWTTLACVLHARRIYLRP